MPNTNSTSDSHNAPQSSRKPHTSQKTQKAQASQSPQEPRRPKPMEVLREARAQLAELTGVTAESVSSFEQTDEGWALEIEVLELERVPDTMSLMASYRVELDAEGQLTGYRRVRRYERGRADARGSR
ncbi:gas vesicle protein [Streptomyces sp. NPDC085944]|uniref:gas vesicle protein GvpO n=1 Tax=Streptomyces sp. NPDC085944 TaxID=3154962 RepID=UPI003438D311